MKKIGALVFLFLIFFAQWVYAQYIPIVGDLDEKVEGTKEKVEEGVEKIKSVLIVIMNFVTIGT